jgi:hypothetical protein
MKLPSIDDSYQTTKQTIEKIKLHLEKCLNFDNGQDREIISKFNQEVVDYDSEVQKILSQNGKSVANSLHDSKVLYNLSWKLIKDLDSLLNSHPKKEEIIDRIREIRNQEFRRIQRLRILTQMDD